MLVGRLAQLNIQKMNFLGRIKSEVEVENFPSKEEIQAALVAAMGTEKAKVLIVKFGSAEAAIKALESIM